VLEDEKTTRSRTYLGRIALTCLVGGALFLAACNSDDDNGDNGDTTAVPTVTETETATETATATATETETATETPTATETADADTTLRVEEEGDLAPFLVDADGMTLYTFANDEDGVSNCDADCEANWPPLTVEAGEEPTAGEGADGTLGTIERDDGTLHVTYDGQPLYTYTADTAPGDTNGHEVGDLWFIAEPDGSASAS